LSKNENFVKHSKSCQELKILPRIQNLVKNSKFFQKFKFNLLASLWDINIYKMGGAIFGLI